MSTYHYIHRSYAALQVSDIINGYHYNDVIMGAMASQITILPIVYTTVFSGAVHRKHQSSASQAFVWGIHRWPVNSPRKWPVTWKIFPFDDFIMRKVSLCQRGCWSTSCHTVTSWHVNAFYSALLAFASRTHRSSVGFTHKGPVMRIFDALCC